MSNQATVQGTPSTPAPALTGVRERRGLRALDYLTLTAIGVVVVLVSLPRLRAFALRENEQDAMRTLRILSNDAVQHAPRLGAGGLGALLATNDTHRVRLDDLEVLGDGRLRRHGYLFDAAETAPGRWQLRAWPWEHEHSGRGAFQQAPGGQLYRWANADGAFSGPARPPPALADPAGAGWSAVRAP